MPAFERDDLSTIDEKENAIDKEGTDKRASIFIKELIWCIKDKTNMQVF